MILPWTIAQRPRRSESRLVIREQSYQRTRPWGVDHQESQPARIRKPAVRAGESQFIHEEPEPLYGLREEDGTVVTTKLCPGRVYSLSASPHGMFRAAPSCPML